MPFKGVSSTSPASANEFRMNAAGVLLGVCTPDDDRCLIARHRTIGKRCAGGVLIETCDVRQSPADYF